MVMVMVEMEMEMEMEYVHVSLRLTHGMYPAIRPGCGVRRLSTSRVFFHRIPQQLQQPNMSKRLPTEGSSHLS